MKIKEFRQSKNLTQDALASELGVTRSAVAMWEIGAVKPRAENLIQMSVIFGCTIDELLKDSGE